MEWINSKDKKPNHEDFVIVAMWRPEYSDYTYYIAIWDIRDLCWLEYGEGDDLEETCGYEIIYWADIPEPKPMPIKY